MALWPENKSCVVMFAGRNSLLRSIEDQEIDETKNGNRKEVRMILRRQTPVYLQTS